MTNFKKGDILVCLEDCKTCNNTNPIFKGQLVKVEGSGGDCIWFTITPALEGNYNIEDFRLATKEEVEYYNNGGLNIKYRKPKFKVGDIVFLEKYGKHPDESEDWALSAKLPLNSPLEIRNISSKGFLYFTNYIYFHHQNKFKPISELKNKEEEFKVGDWVVFEVEKARKLRLSNSFWCKDMVLQIDQIFNGGLRFDAKKVNPTNTGKCSNDIKCFRKALPHEIPSQKVETQYITSIDQLQKGKWYRCKYKDTSGDYYFKFRDHQSGYINTICNSEGKGKPNTLEVYAWGNFDHCINLHEIPDPTIEKVGNQEVKSEQKEIVIPQLVTPKVEPYKFKQQELPRLNYKIEVKKEKVTPYILKTQSLNY